MGGTGGVHILDTSACDGIRYCTPRLAGFWHINGDPVQAAAYHGLGKGAYHGVIQRFFTYDAHNLDLKGENTLLVANYSMGIRMVDTTDKSHPVEVSFYLPNANKNDACNQNCFFQGRETVNGYYEAAPAIVQRIMDRFGELTGRAYALFEYYGAPDAERVGPNRLKG